MTSRMTSGDWMEISSLFTFTFALKIPISAKALTTDESDDVPFLSPSLINKEVVRVYTGGVTNR